VIGEALAELGVGAALGLAAGLAPGPLMALVVAQSLRHGTGAGLRVALAPLITDLPIVVGSLLVIGVVTGSDAILGGIALAGALVVAWIALDSLRTGVLDPSALADSAPRGRSWTLGATVNALSPHPYLFWLTVGAPRLAADLRAGPLPAAAFVAGFYACLVGSKVALALAAGRARRRLLGPAYAWVMRALGVALLAFAGSLALQGLRLLGLAPA
jgi:threonine/homoserine/homoserine lactone efflux protein